jgi:IS5 family transposase
VLDETPEVMSLVFVDLTRGVMPNNGRPGMTAEEVVRVGLVKQMNGFSYDELEFHLADSRTYRTFCRLPAFGETPSASCLQENLRRVLPETWEAVNRLVVGVAKDDGIEAGRKVRVDCTVTDTNIHRPDDAAQLWDSVRVLTRLMAQAVERFGGELNAGFTDHTRRAKRRYLSILNAKNAEGRSSKYSELLKIARKTIGYAGGVAEALLPLANHAEPGMAKAAISLELELTHYIPLARRVVDQTERRVLRGESVPAGEKVVSIFEPHTDIIIKKRREVEFGHKLCLTTGASSLVLDCVIQQGNPADSELAVEMIARQVEIYGRPPRQAAFDGGFASKANHAAIKAKDVRDVAF